MNLPIQPKVYEEKMLYLTSVGLLHFKDYKSFLQENFPQDLKNNEKFAEHVCGSEPSLFWLFDPSIFESTTLIKSILKRTVKDHGDYLRSINKEKMNKQLLPFIQNLPSMHVKNKELVMWAINLHPDLIYQWSASHYSEDEEYENAMVEKCHSDHYWSFDLKHPPKRSLAVKLCKKEAGNYFKVQRYFRTDLELACIAAAAPKGEDLAFGYLDKRIKRDAVKLARVLVSSSLKKNVGNMLSQEELTFLSQAMRAIDPSKPKLMDPQNVYEAAKLILAHDEAVRVKAALTKATAVPKKKSVPSSAFKKSI